MENQEEEKSCNYKRKTTIFFKKIDDFTISLKTLIIPENFVEKYGDELSAIVTLNVIEGGIWQVGILRVQHWLCLGANWPEFMKHHSIHAGSFLVFGYRGNSRFDVYVFDLNTEKILSFPDPTPPGNNVLEEFREKSAATETLEPHSLKRSCQSHPNWFTSRATGNAAGRRSETSYSQESSSRERSEGKLYKKLKMVQDNIEFGRKHNIQEQPCESKLEISREIRTKEAERAILACKQYAPRNPSCRVILPTTYARRGYLRMPMKFARTYLKGDSERITLEISSGQRWLVSLVRGEDYFRLCNGWREFAEKNQLEVGDVCVFELVEPTNLVLKVTFFRAFS